jgi:hypothetical protein
MRNGAWLLAPFPFPSLFGLAPCGVYPASALLPERCALTAPFHPYPAFLSRTRVDQKQLAGAVTILARHGKVVDYRTYGQRDMATSRR